MSIMRNTLGKEQVSQDLDKPGSNAALREYCDRNYHQLLPIIVEKVHQEKVQKEKLKAVKAQKLKAVKARLNFEETSQHSESGTPNKRRDLKKGLDLDVPVACPKALNQGAAILSHQRKRDPKIKMVFKRMEKSVFHRLEDKGKSTSSYSNDLRSRSYHSIHRDTESYYQSSHSRETEFAFERHHNKRASSRRTEASSKSEGSAGGHWKSRTKRQKSSVEDDLSQPWKKSIKDPVKIHNIKQRDGESTKEFLRRYKLKCRDVKGAPECMEFFRFMHEITNPELIKRLHDKISKSVNEVMRVTTTFLRGKVAALTVNGRNHFHHGNNKKPDKSRTSRREDSRTNKGQNESKTYSPPHKDTKKDHGFRQRKV
nr:reverse transcriptase domain-containing protein [Tanacetum cinerariifolium]